MTRRPFIAGNWKMNCRKSGASDLVAGLLAGNTDEGSVDVAVCPPMTLLGSVGEQLAGTSIGLGGQTLHPAGDGAFTGEVNAGMLADVGCEFVILGHSERRQLFGETNATVNEKLHAALAGSLTPIVCVGETLEERESEQTTAVVQEQLRGSLEGLDAARAG
ncbi:MAG: triose-phosphate isomerase, partial [Planctomycetota bacterium]